VLAGYIGDEDDDGLDHAVAEFADGYADITEGDHAAHAAAIDEGRIPAVRDIQPPATRRSTSRRPGLTGRRARRPARSRRHRPSATCPAAG
jgi:hypothetical protein